MYSTLATGKENLAKLALPSDPDRGGYTGRKIDDELVAEAFYAAAIDPNYVKTVAPKTYEWLAKLVEDNPDVNKWIHFNSFGAAPLAPRSGLEEMTRPVLLMPSARPLILLQARHRLLNDPGPPVRPMK